jgi:hypothetical protein
MTFLPADPVASGRPYPVLEVSGAAPAELAQFVGEAVFTIDRDGVPAVVCGQGCAGEPGVVFREKDVGHSGKDVRTWQISQSGSAFTAATLSRF